MTSPNNQSRNNILTPGFRSFLLIWLGQVVSLTGSSMTGFALGVWVFQETGSVTQFALIALSSTLPSIIFAPFSGALVDRWNRRTAMILSDAGSALCTLAITLLLFTGRLEIWHLYIILAISSLFNSFQWPAYSSSITLLVPKKQFGRASGMVQIADGIAGIGAPLLAGTLMGFLPVYSIMFIDIITFLFALLTLIAVRIPQPEVSRESQEVRGSLLREAAFGWKFIAARPGLLGLLLFFASTNFFFSIAQVLFTPMVLSFSTPATLGLILSTGGFGMLAGSLFMSIWGGPKRKIAGILGFGLFQALVAAAAGATVNVTFISAMVFLVFFNNPVINACSQAIWQSKTTPDVQGRVFSVRRMIAWGTIPLANLIAGPLADKVFEPWMAADGLLAGSIGRILGVGPGRGIGLLFVLLGLFSMLSTLILAFYAPTRHVETVLPDAVPDLPPL
jgi:MFS family permease